MSKDQFVVKHFTNKCWEVAEVWKNGEKIATANLFYDVTQDWIIIYSTAGGSGIGWKKGDIIEKIYIGDSEFRLEKV